MNSNGTLKKVGILDPEGKYKNPLNNLDYTSSYKYFSNMWKNLPMYKEVSPSKIIKDIIDHQVIILESGTGSGKSVLMPKYALHSVNYKGKIVITNPKQLPTFTNAEFAAKCLDVKLGEEVGFQFQGSKLSNGKKSYTESTNLLFSTDGSVVEVARKDPFLKKYDVVIIDEAHERNMRIDLLLVLMKRALRLNKELKLIVMSATLPGNLFYEYFKEFSIINLEVSGKSNKPVIDYYLNTPIKNKTQTVEYSVELVITEIIKKEREGDILIFVNSFNEAKRTIQLLQERLKEESNEKVFAIPLASEVKDEKIKNLAKDENLFREEPGGPWNRKLVVGTNQLESSITIDGVVYVIDSGTQITNVYNPDSMKTIISKDKISIAQAKQRKGRAGRTRDGVCYKLYTKKEEEKFSKDPVVDIKKSNITGDILNIFDENYDTVGKVLGFLDEYIEKPPDKFINSSIKILKALNLINSSDNSGVLTEKGRKVNYINKLTGYDVQLSSSLISSLDYDMEFDMSALASIIINLNEKPDAFFKKARNKEDEKKLDILKGKFVNLQGDIFVYLYLYKIFYKNTKFYDMEELYRETEKYQLNFPYLLKVRENHIKIYQKLMELKNYKNDVTKYDYSTNLILSLMEGYYINTAYSIGKNLYKNWFPKIKSTEKLDSDFYNGKKKYVLYMSLNSILRMFGGFTICIGLTVSQIKIFNRKFGYDIPVFSSLSRKKSKKDEVKGKKKSKKDEVKGKKKSKKDEVKGKKKSKKDEVKGKKKEGDDRKKRKKGGNK
jgi:pre-mRNA-splicing factor ATP-dependent RNA helicase DHX15/PRP43